MDIDEVTIGGGGVMLLRLDSFFVPSSVLGRKSLGIVPGGSEEGGGGGGLLSRRCDEKVAE